MLENIFIRDQKFQFFDFLRLIRRLHLTPRYFSTFFCRRSSSMPATAWRRGSFSETLGLFSRLHLWERPSLHLSSVELCSDSCRFRIHSHFLFHYNKCFDCSLFKKRRFLNFIFLFLFLDLPPLVVLHLARLSQIWSSHFSNRSR